ncbi:unnamed protein product [Musa hybrid cultivar]
MASAFSLPTLYWKWMSPLGTTNISPGFKTLEKNWLLVLMNPTSSRPLRRMMSSVALGWLWGGLVPPGATSTRFMETPRVLSPGKLSTLALVTLDPKILLVLPSLDSPAKKKSSDVTPDAGLHGNPLTTTVAPRSATQKSWRGSGSARINTRRTVKERKRMNGLFV